MNAPGPWVNDGSLIKSIDHGQWSIVAEVKTGKFALAALEGNTRLIAAAPDLLSALVELRKELRAHIKLDVKKHFSLMVADAAASKAVHKARPE